MIRYLRASRIGRRLLWIAGLWHLLGAVLLVTAPIASAAPTTPEPHQAPSNSDSYFGFMELKDSAGINVWDYHINFNEGGWRHPMKAVFNLLVSLEYEIFRFITAGAIWALGFALSLTWLDWLTRPAQKLAHGLDQIVDSFGLTPLMFSVVALVGSIWLIRGRYATGFFEMFSACLIAAISVVLLSSPVERVAGPNGMLFQARDAGIEIGVGLIDNGNTAGGSAAAATRLKIIQANLTDNLVRRPTQMLNFSVVLDDDQNQKSKPGCVKGWETAQRTGKDSVPVVKKECAGGDYMAGVADNPGASQVMAGSYLMVLGGLLGMFSALVALLAFMAAGWALWSAVKLIPASVLGIASGPGRDMWWRCVAGAAMALVLLVIIISFTMGYMLVVDSFFSSAPNPMARFAGADAALIGGIILLRMISKRLRETSERLAKKLASARPQGSSSGGTISRTPGVSPKTVVHGVTNTAGRAARTAGQLYYTKSLSNTGTATPGSESTTVHPRLEGMHLILGEVADTSAMSTSTSTSATSAPANKMPSASSAVPDPVPLSAVGGHELPHGSAQIEAPSTSASTPMAEHRSAEPQVSRVAERQRNKDSARPGIRRPTRSAGEQRSTPRRTAGDRERARQRQQQGERNARAAKARVG